MKFSEIKQLHLEDFYWRLIFGRSKARTSFFELRANGFSGLPTPVFFLSTGRCGTNWFTLLLSNNQSLKVFHEPRPNFGVQGKVAFELYSQHDFRLPPHENTLLREIFLTGREQHLRYSYKTQRRFVETNNQITFLAPAIFSLFPQTKFIHLNRHPGEFVRSAMRRNFYANTEDIKRIVPVKGDPFYQGWDSLGAVEKNSWLWMATNTFIERFKSTLPGENHFYFDFNQLDEMHIGRLASFLDIHLDRKMIQKMLRKPVNVQHSGDVAGYHSWPDGEKESLRRICGNLAATYNYQL